METPSSTNSEVFCKNCENLIGVRHNLFAAENWKCGAKENKKGIDLVTGETTYKVTSCASQRGTLGSGFCGIEGKWFKLYIPPKETYPVESFPLEKKSSLKALTLDDL